MNTARMRKPLAYTALLLSIAAIVYYLFFTLHPQQFSENEIVDSYALPDPEWVPELTLEQESENQYRFRFLSFDGDEVTGRIHYPEQQTESYRVVLGLHAMGRSYQRWWQAAIGDRPTLEHVNRIGDLARERNYVLIAIDARDHGQRKREGRDLRSTMMGLTFFGRREPYESMIRDTVRDYRALIKWINQQQQLEGDGITVVGYSMGAQMALILAALEPKVQRTASIVPPFIDDSIARVAPKNLVHKIGNREVLLISGDDDEYASAIDNQALFDAIGSRAKEHIVHRGGHLLPENYVDTFEDWL